MSTKKTKKKIAPKKFSATAIPHNSKIIKQGVAAAKKLFESINWNEWWTEFCTSFRKGGDYLYPTVGSLINSKTTDPAERKILYWAIGPRRHPSHDKIAEDEKARELFTEAPIPHLGDWAAKRENLTLYNSDKMVALEKMIEERFDGIEASRGVAKLVLDDIARWTQLQSQVDRVFGGVGNVLKVADDFEELSDKEQKEYLSKVSGRFALYLSLQRDCAEARNRSITRYLKCHGIGDDQLTAVATMALSGAAALAGAATVSKLAEKRDNHNPVTMMIADLMVKKAQRLGTKMPDEDVQEIIDLQLDQTKG